jgi:hypothetical protein
MYSTCKGPLIDLLEGELSMELVKKVGILCSTCILCHTPVSRCKQQLEIGEASEFTQEWLYDQVGCSLGI